jgi:amino acid adenylation domain-containing protein
VLSLVFHHILTDGWSLGILLRDLGVLYESGPATLEPLPVQYADFAVWQRDWYASGALEPQGRYWQARLAHAPAVLALATDRPRPAVSSQAGGVVRFVIGRDLRTGVQRLARTRHATPFMVLLALFKLYLHRRSASADVCVGIPTTSRTRTEFERVAGYFGNTLVVRDRLDGIADFASFLERVKESCLEAYAHQDLPFERVIELLKVERRADASPLFQAMFVMEHEGDAPRLALGELACVPLPLEAVHAKFDLTLAVREEGAVYEAAFVYASALFDASTVERMATHVVRLLESILAAPEAGLAKLAWVGEAERATLLDKFSAVQRPHDEGHTLSAQFERSVAARPDAVALVDGSAQLTYRELNRRANRLAHRLLAHGVLPEARVALIAARGLEQLIGMLAILKAGGAYVPIDPDYPAERIAYILGDAGISVALIGESGVGVLPASVRTVIRIGDSSAAGCEYDPVVAVSPANTAYVIYTSGSTGRPKGVQIAHANVVRLFSATLGVFGFGADEVWTLFHSFAFDFSVWEIWGALLYQGRLVCVPYLVSRDAEAFHGLLVEQCVTVLNQTPSAFRQLIQADQTQPSTARLRLQWVVFGGEALDASMLRAWYERHPQRPRLVNMYGITETTVHVTHQLLDHDAARPAMRCVGRPIEDQAVYVLDRDLQPVPIGLTGELHVGGAGLAIAYLNRPDLTAERFVPDPYSGVPGARMYRSGDAGRFAADGRLDHLGRIDEQVKIRGFRIEPGEIHAALLDHPQVGAAIIDIAQGAAGPELVAYVVAAGAAPSAEELRHHLGARLPAHMVPGSYCMIDAIPLTPNGKVDRRALPAPAAAPVARAYVAPVTSLEKQLAAIWSEVLRQERVGRLDEFFELGGHSLSATQVVFLVRERLGLQATLRALFEHPRLQAFAHHLGTLPAQSQARPAAHVSAPIPVRRR